MKPVMMFLVLLCSFFLYSDLLAQESGSQYIERQERVESFVEFVGLLERAEDVWITPFDLEAGFYLEANDELVGRKEAQLELLKPEE